jgi:magnesium transporter
VALLGISLGVLVGCFSLFWQEGVLPAISIAVGIMVAVSVSAVFGIFMPILLNRMKLDPKVASGPVVLMIVDILTTAVYLGFATWWLL